MKAHRSLTAAQVRAKGPAAIALMVASEFGRAATGAKYRSDVLRCYDRARELMGLLEVLNLPGDVALHLRPLYKRCTLRELLKESRLTPAFIERASREMADAFDRAASLLAV
jgi:hypothetical protein